MKRILLGLAASALVLGLTAQAGPARADLASGLTNFAAADQATDLSSAKKKKKKKAMGGSKGTGGGASKAGTGGGAGGEGGAGSSSERQTGTPRGNPATPAR
jgi:hypothetical protein